MDVNEVIERARVLLAAMARYAGAVDRESLVSTSYNQNPGWLSDPVLVILNMRAFTLLERASLIRLNPSGYGYELSESGRGVVQGGSIAEFSGAWFKEWVEIEQLLEALRAQRTSTETVVNRLVVQNWRQFSTVDLIFHPRLTILTGANGSGKTTLLNMLAPHFNWSAQLLTRQAGAGSAPEVRDVGFVSYSNGANSPLLQHASNGVSNSPISISQMQQVMGIFINSHRSVSSYQPLEALPPRFSEWDSLQQQFAYEIQLRYSGGNSKHSPLHRMKEALVSAAMFAYGNAAVRANESARELWEGYQHVLQRFLPEYLQFERLEVEDAEIILVTKSAEFPLEAASGGISAMLELSWQIYLRQRNQTAFTVCIDEPENHLHPELQRSIVPSLLAGFPDVSFIISTHSPLVVTSAPASYVYALGADNDGKISSRRVGGINSTGTPDETLLSVLGLDSTLPIWAEARLSELLEALPPSPSAQDLRKLRNQLVAIGLDRQFPAAVNALGLES